ncbi:MAG: STAS-like domain-containing protein [Bacteroidales bacterium]|nr:STAS-like domain-containing protein [Bacteroidales bacterium]
MNEYRVHMNQYKHLVIRKVEGVEVYNDIKNHLDAGEVVIIDFSGIDTMTTYFAKQVFGRLYTEMGSEVFTMNVKFDKRFMTEDLDLVLRIGIAGAISDLQK